MQKRIEIIDLLRGFAAFCMIVGHSFIKYPVDISSVDWCRCVKDFIFYFHMELFFLVSGFVYSCYAYKDYIIKKCKRIGIPYIIFGLITMLLHSYGGTSVNRHSSLEKGLYDFFFSGGSYWFLYVLFEIFIIMPVIDRLRQKIKYLSWIIIFCSVVLLQFFNIGEFLRLHSLFFYSTFFLIGYELKDNYKTINYSIYQRYWHILFVGSFICTIYLVFLGNTGDYVIDFLRAITIIFCVFVIFSFIFKDKQNNVVERFRKNLKLCSEYSLQLYLFNGFIMVPTRVIICNLLHITEPFVISVSIIITSVCGTFFICKYVVSKNKLLCLVCGIPYINASVE